MTRLPGWWGKLPGAGDFAHRRLPDDVRTRLDDWLQTELGGLRARHANWQPAYLNAPLWYFAAGSGLLTHDVWLGILMPSVDRVGRYFPLLILQPADESSALEYSADRWWRLAAEAALEALSEDYGPEALERALDARFREVSAGSGGQRPDATALAWPGCSQWSHTERRAAPLRFEGWPQGACFDALFDLAGSPAAVEPEG